MVTCLGDAFFPEVGVASVRLLRRLGVGVDFPRAQTCCGQPHFNSGYHTEARDLARHTIGAFAGAGTVVVPSGSCAAMVKLEYPELFRDDLHWHARALDLAGRTRELSDFLVNVLGVEDLGARYEGKAVFHTGCHQRRELGLLREPRGLLQNVDGLELLDWKDERLCCGFGGTFSVKMPVVSTAMADEKIRALEESGADTLISGDSSCLMHLEGRLRRTGHDTRVYHLAQILDPDKGEAR